MTKHRLANAAAPLIAACTLSAVPAALAQQNEPGGTTPLPDIPPATSPKQAPDAPKPTAPGNGPVALESEPYPIPELDLTIHLPINAEVVAYAMPNGKKMVRVTPPDRTWAMQIYNNISSDKELTIKGVLDGIIKQRQARAPLNPTTRRRLQIDQIERTDDLTIKNVSHKAGRVYVRHFGTQKDGSGGMVKNGITTGYTVFKTDPGRFLIVQFDARESSFDARKKVYETMVASARFDVEGVGEKQNRHAAVATGERFLQKVTPEVVESVLPEEPVYLRIYRPSQTGSDLDAREVAFQKIDIHKGQLGELDPDRPKVDWGPADREYGFIVRVDARFLAPDDTVIDTRAIFFRAREGSKESWAVNTTKSKRGEKEHFEIHLERYDRSLTVRRIALPDRLDETRDWQTPEQGFISAVDRYLLPRLAAEIDIAADMAFYHYDLGTEGVTLVHESFEKSENGWKRFERRKIDQDPFEYTYDTNGVLQRTLWPNGNVTEVVTREELRELWKRKDLPLK